jgi:TonB-linked SusC/RagA family outer membrane protein
MKKTIQTIVMATLCIIFNSKAQEPIKPPSLKNQVLIGKVISAATGESLPGALIKVTTTNQTIVSNDKGDFILNLSKGSYNLSVHYLNYKTKHVTIQIPLNEKLILGLEADDNPLNEVQIIGYGQVSKRLNTGSVSSITAKEIENQPVTNVLSALSGRMPGVFVQTTNGLPGGNISIQIRGKGSIAAGTDPLYIIDGVPFPTTSISNAIVSSNVVNGSISPLNSINPADIASISILKDADATAIYGSRGANGVVLIETKKGKTGNVKSMLNYTQGINKVANLPDLLNLEQYLQLRREAFANDGLIPSSVPTSSSYAPDLTVWDQHNSTDWADYMLGGTGNLSKLNYSLSGGSNSTTFNAGTNYSRESTILPGDNEYQRGGLNIGIQHKSPDGKFFFSMSAIFVYDKNLLANPSATIASNILTPPNFPLQDVNGNLDWTYGSNPLAGVKRRSNAVTQNFTANTTTGFNFSSNLSFKTNLGINTLSLEQIVTNPKASQNPNFTTTSSTYFGNSSSKSVIIEPQLDYRKIWENSVINVLMGGTYQQSLSNNNLITATNFSSEGLLENVGSAAALTATNSSSNYKYASVFGRVNYNLAQKYLLNISFRRDGSSRFGSGNQFGNFGAVGAAWIFSAEQWIQKVFPLLSYGKLRASYGITGSDNINDYQFLSTYRSSGHTYQNISGLTPSKIANDKFQWEVTKKLELGIELGFFNNKFQVSVNRYQNVSSNQLVYYGLPYFTGFSSYLANLPAVITNMGWELELNSKNIKLENFAWSSSFNVTKNVNRLKEFPDLSNSSYVNTYVIGESISRAYGYMYVGDPNSGAPAYALKDGGTSVTPAFTNSYYTLGVLNPKFYGGLNNTFTYKRFELDLFFQFAKQIMKGALINPGGIQNAFSIVRDRWTAPGQYTNIPKASTINSPYYPNSSANYFDASYIRFKNISLSYTVNPEILKALKADRLTMSISGQNLLTFWNKNTGLYDPESGASSNIPPLKSYVLGFQLIF